MSTESPLPGTRARRVPVRLVRCSLVLLASGGLVHAAQDAGSPDGPERLRALLAAAHERGGFHGNVLAAEHGRVVLEASFGLADDATGRPLDEETVFELASISKPITSVAVLRLVERGVLELDAPVRATWQEFPLADVTPRHLLTHTSGLIGHEDFFGACRGTEYEGHPLDNATVTRLLAEQAPPPRAEPGAAFDYNNLGYIALAELCERVTRKTFAEVLHAEVFAPAGLESAWLVGETVPPERAAALARDYVRDEEGRWAPAEEAPGWDFTTWLGGLVGDGGVRMTARDLLRFDTALFPPETGASGLLTDPSRADLCAAFTLRDGTRFFEHGWTRAGYGLGLWVAPDGGSVWHTGDWGGYLTYWRHWFGSGHTVILLQNRRSDDWSWLGELEALAAREEPWTR